MAKKIILLRGVTPTGKNRIPKMSDLVEILEAVGFLSVKTYIQSGNIILNTDLSDEAIKRLVHDTILKQLGADLSVIIKLPEQLTIAAQEDPFDATYDASRIHLVFTNDDWSKETLADLTETDFGAEAFVVGSECLYLYLPREAKKKRLNTNFLEKKLGIRATMRKLSVTSKLSEM